MSNPSPWEQDEPKDVETGAAAANAPQRKAETSANNPDIVYREGEKGFVRGVKYAWDVTNLAINSFGHTFAPYLMESIGTFFLVLTVGLTTEAKNSVATIPPLAIGSMLMVLVFMGGHVSGAHYNPAVTLAVFLSGRRKINFITMLAYFILQIFWGFMGGLVAHSISGGTTSFGPAFGSSQRQAFTVEILFTFVLCYCVLNVATTKSNRNNSFYGLGIGFSVVGGIYGAGEVSGGALNPAVGIGCSVTHVLHREDGTLDDLWIYIIGPMLGGVLAALAFRFTNPKEYDADFGNETFDVENPNELRYNPKAKGRAPQQSEVEMQEDDD